MTLIILPASSAVRMPWKNGRGSTLELAADADAGQPWTWRLSLADVPESGAFSRFEGCERHILCVDGPGMRLVVDGCEEPVPHEGEALRFSGDADTCGLLVGGPCRDANLIVRRDRWRGRLKLMRGAVAGTTSAHRSLIHLVAGELEVDGRAVEPGGTARVEGAMARFLGAGVVLVATVDDVAWAVQSSA